MGRKKIEIIKHKDLRDRKTTFSKRGYGFIKKAHELSTLCDSDVGVIMFSPTGDLVSYCRPETTMEEVLERFVGTSEGQTDTNIELVNELLRQRNIERKGKSPLPRMMAVRERRLTEQREVVVKQQESECLTGRLKQSQPLEDLIMTRVQESASLAELDDLENWIKTRLSKVQESKQDLRRQEIENELIEILQSSPLPDNPKECYPSGEATNKAGTSLLQSLPMPTPTPDNPKDWSPFAEATDEAETSLLQSLLMPTPTADNSKECSPFAEATNEAGTSLLQSLPMPTPTLMDNPYLQHLHQMEQTHSTVGQRLLSATSLLKSFAMSTPTLMDNPYLQHRHQMQQAHSTVGQRLLSFNGKHIVNFGQASGVGANERIMPSKPVLDFYLSTIPEPYRGEVVC